MIRVGIVVAMAARMAGVTRFEDLDAWKLSAELRDLVYRMTDAGPAARDFKFRDQIRDSAASAPRNLAEGFGRFNPREFAQYARWAKASQMETRNHLLHGQKERYFSGDSLTNALRLCKRALGATKGLHRYLMSCNGKLPWETDDNRTQNRTENQNQNQNQNQEPEPEPEEPREPPEPPEPRQG